MHFVEMFFSSKNLLTIWIKVIKLYLRTLRFSTVIMHDLQQKQNK